MSTILHPTIQTRYSLGDRVTYDGRPYLVTGLSVAYLETADGAGHDVWYSLEDLANPEVHLYAPEPQCQEGGR